jgi:16S rRNA (cytosine967-C5)-methyltransferase
MANEPGAEPHGPVPNPRRQALEVISQALSPTGKAFARELLDERFSRAPMKPEDRRLTADLTYGVIRRLATLDAVLAAYSTRPLVELDPGVLQILRLGVYQMLFLERVPQHAIVDESVRLARATGKSRATGFVNAVLRSLGRELRFVPEPDPAQPQQSFELAPGFASAEPGCAPAKPGRACILGRKVLPPPKDSAAYLAAVLSFPVGLMRRWLARYGTSRASELCRLANEPPPLFIRPNTLRTTPEQLIETLRAEEIEARPSASGRTLLLPSRTQVAKLRAFHDGLFQVQDDSSATVAPFVGPQPGENVLDLCAAPGGKACHMAELMQNKGMIAAVDDSARRLERLVENVQRLDLRIIATIESEGANFAHQHPGKFDRVLLDAPCSNTGVLRRRVEARWRFSDAAVAELAGQQRALLEAALHCQKPGGTLVYSTCSVEPEENAQQVAAALRNAPGFRLESQQEFLPAHEAGDGLFMAKIIRVP